MSQFTEEVTLAVFIARAGGSPVWHERDEYVGAEVSICGIWLNVVVKTCVAVALDSLTGG